MEPITTTFAVSSVASYLAKKLKDNPSVQGFFDDFTEATVNWIKPFFIKEDGTPEKVLKDLQDKPDSPARQDAVKSTIAVALEENPQAEKLLQEMAAFIETKKFKEESVTISGKNVNTGTIHASGHVTLGDNNTFNK